MRQFHFEAGSRGSRPIGISPTGRKKEMKMQWKRSLIRTVLPFVFLAAAVVPSAQAGSAKLGDQLYTLTADTPADYDRFGAAAGADTKLSAIGAPDQGDGAVYVYDNATGAKLRKIPSPGGSITEFGRSVAVSGNRIAIGAKAFFGTAFLYDADTGNQLFQVNGSESTFGLNVDLEGDFMIVSSRDDEARLYDANTGNLLHTLLPEDPLNNSGFGWDVAISGNVAIVGRLGAGVNAAGQGAYVFDVTTGNQLRKLVPDNQVFDDNFGIEVEIESGIAIVSAFRDEDLTGAVYLFDASTGNQLQKLVAGDGAEGDRFGWAVGISRGVAAIGALQADSTRGAVYLFNVASGGLIEKIQANDTAVGDYFGYSLAMANGRMAIGAVQTGTDPDGPGTAYLFDSVRYVSKPSQSDFDPVSGPNGESPRSITTGVIGESGRSGRGARLVAGPNPFRSQTALRFSIDAPTEARVVVHAINGREVARLFAGRASGANEIIWDGRDASGRPLAAGVYFATLETPTDRVMKRLVLVR